MSEIKWNVAGYVTLYSLNYTAAEINLAISTQWGPLATDHNFCGGRDDISFVLATLGEQLFALKVIDPTALPAARIAVRQAFHSVDSTLDEWGNEFENLPPILQYAVTSAMVFCAECWPMPIWQGFGCGVMNNPKWIDVFYPKSWSRAMDDTIATLKSKSHGWRLLTKSPFKISQTEPYFRKYETRRIRRLKRWDRCLTRQMEKRGHPQPKPPYSRLNITSWSVPFATWGGNSVYENHGHSSQTVLTCQMDPGRFLWAWTLGGHIATLKPGEAIIVDQDPVSALAKWLEGLEGNRFRVLLDTDLDWSHLRIPWCLQRYSRRTTGVKFGMSGEPYLIIADHEAGRPRSDIPSTLLSGQPLSQKSNALRSTRTIKASHSFDAINSTELSYQAGDVMEVLDDSSTEGWWLVRLNGKTGYIPPAFVRRERERRSVLDIEPVEEETSVTDGGGRIACKDINTRISFGKNVMEIVDDFRVRGRRVSERRVSERRCEKSRANVIDSDSPNNRTTDVFEVDFYIIIAINFTTNVSVTYSISFARHYGVTSAFSYPTNVGVTTCIDLTCSIDITDSINLTDSIDTTYITNHTNHDIRNTKSGLETRRQRQ